MLCNTFEFIGPGGGCFDLRGYYSKAQKLFFSRISFKVFFPFKKKKDSIFRVLNPRERERERKNSKKNEREKFFCFFLSLFGKPSPISFRRRRRRR